jgi:hypothetical protein
MRRFNVWMPHEPIIGVGLIIREDQYNIGCFSSANKYKEQVDKEEGFFHKLQVVLFSEFRHWRAIKNYMSAPVYFLQKIFRIADL